MDFLYSLKKNNECYNDIEIEQIRIRIFKLKNNIALVTRTFQPNKNRDTFDLERFQERFVTPLNNLRSGNVFDKIFIIVNIEKGNKYAEETTDGISASKYHITKQFKEEVDNGTIVVVDLDDWGKNAGSANALTMGLLAARGNNIKYVMNWSSEMDIKPEMVLNCLGSIKKDGYNVIGFLRDFWWKKHQWLIAQNTASIWNVNSLIAVNGFSTYCDNNTKSISSYEHGTVPLQGMEDFYSMLLMSKNDKNFKWAMLGRSNPIKWNMETEGEEGKRNEKKVYRQYHVMEHYVDIIYGKDKERTMELIFDKLTILD